MALRPSFSTFAGARGAIALAAAALGFVVTGFMPQVLNDGDTFLHVAAGRRMLTEHAILFRDPFSYTFAGAPWDAHEWLAEIAMALCHAAGGWRGVLILFALAAACAAGALSYALGRWLEPKAQALATVLALSCMTASLLARPHLLALPLLVLWTAALAKARDEQRAPPLALAALMALWVNIHGSFLLGLALAGGLALEALVARRRWDVLRDWSLFGLCAVGAALLNPHGWNGLAFPFALMDTAALGHVGEWQATPLSLFQPVVPIAIFTAYIVLSRRVAMSPIRAAMLLALAYLAFAHARHQMVLAAVAPLLLAQPLSAALGRARADTIDWRAAGAVATVLLVLLAGLRLAMPLTRGDAAAAPMTALAHVQPSLRAQPVLNDYSFGGYLIFAGVKPFIDSRVELYGEAALERYAALIKPDRAMLDDQIRRHAIAWAILPPASPIVAELDASPGWHRLFADHYAVVQFRDKTAR